MHRFNGAEAAVRVLRLYVAPDIFGLCGGPWAADAIRSSAR